jgi:hypothetical protein
MGAAPETFFQQLTEWANDGRLKYVIGVSVRARRARGIVRYPRSSYDFGRFKIGFSGDQKDGRAGPCVSN